VPIATIASAALRARTTGCTKPLNIMAIGASRQNAGVMNYTKRGSAAGTPVIDGGMNMSIAGIRNTIGMITTTTATTTESLVPCKSGSGKFPLPAHVLFDDLPLHERSRGRVSGPGNGERPRARPADRCLRREIYRRTVL
jgi:hypothetical protein